MSLKFFHTKTNKCLDKSMVESLFRIPSAILQYYKSSKNETCVVGQTRNVYLR